jgi:hypothetical protein
MGSVKAKSKPKTKDGQENTRMDADELRMIDELVEQTGWSRAQVVRTGLRELYQRKKRAPR